MDRYYKIAKTSETGKKFEELMNRVNDFNTEAKKFIEKYGILKVRCNDFYLRDVSEVVFKDESFINKDNWKKGCTLCGYLLKKNPKDKVLKKDWENLQSKRILRFEIDKIVGGTNNFHQCGFDSTDDFFFIITEKPETFNFPSDVVEISNLEYEELTKKDN